MVQARAENDEILPKLEAEEDHEQRAALLQTTGVGKRMLGLGKLNERKVVAHWGDEAVENL